MGRISKFLGGALCVAILMVAAGFVIFSSAIMNSTPADVSKADGIVVLTGGELRIVHAVDLLSIGKGGRLLISGVNKRTSRRQLRKLTSHQDGDRLFDCCIDIGYKARNTVENAVETREWAENWRFRRLIVVTSSYHMPRSLTELARMLPNTRLYAYPVAPRNFRIEAWWRHPGTARLLAMEYLKFLPAMAKLVMARLFFTSHAPDITTAQADRPDRSIGYDLR